MVATVTAIAEKKNVQRSQRSYGNHFPAIVVIAAITIAEIQLLLSQRTLSLRSQNFFLSAIEAVTWKPGLIKLLYCCRCVPL